MFASKPVKVPELRSLANVHMIFPVTRTVLPGPVAPLKVWVPLPTRSCMVAWSLPLVIPCADQSSVIVVAGLRVTVRLPAVMTVFNACPRAAGGTSKKTSDTDPDESSNGSCGG